MTNNEEDYDICFRVDNVVLPKSGFFGISAATGMLMENIDSIYIKIPLYYICLCSFIGGLADDHDILHFLTTSLYPPGQLPVDGHKVSVEEQAKIQQEYLDYQKKLDEQKEEYRK